MLFPKTASGFSLSTLARSKKLWSSSTSAQGSANPGFFVSTPQFTRHQQSQLVVYAEDGRGAGSSSSTSDSHGIDNPYLALTAGGNGVSAAPNLYLDDDSKEDPHSRVMGPAASSPISRSLSMDQALAPKESRHDQASEVSRSRRSNSPTDAVDEQERLSVVDDMLIKMRRLHASGSHSAVLATFEAMESIETVLPVDAYNLVLETLASTSEVTTLLKAYEKMLMRGIRPNDTTYTIILTSLLDAATCMSSKKEELLPFLGDSHGVLESVDEIYEGLSVDEYLVLGQTLLQAVMAVRPQPWDAELQLCLDRLIDLSIKHGITLPSAVLEAGSSESASLIRLERSVEAAAARFSNLTPDLQQSEDAQLAMLESYFKFQQPSGAIAFFAAWGGPTYLLGPLLKGFASSGLVSTANRWVETTQPGTKVISEVLKSISRSQASEVLPSATELFYAAVGRTGHQGGSSGAGAPADGSAGTSADAGRCAYIRLCVAAENEQALLMGIRESHLKDCAWDAVTIMDVISFLSKRGEPLLGADVCSWQVRKLQLAYEANNIKSFVDQEILSDTVSLLQSQEQLSLDAALRLLPASVSCSSARKGLVDIIAAAKLGSPHEMSEIVTAEKLSVIVSSLASIMTSSTHRATSEELDVLRSIFPLFVEDAISRKSEFSMLDILNVQDALSICSGVEVLSNLWYTRFVKDGMASGDHKGPIVPSEVSLTVQRYALAPNGVPMAVSLLKEQLLIGRTLSSEAVDAVIFACVRNNMTETLKSLGQALPKTQGVLNSLIVAACEVGDVDATQRHYGTLVHELGVYPTYISYLNMIKAAKSNLEASLSLFDEARHSAGLDLGPEMYNAMVEIFAFHQQETELSNILVEMQDKNFKLLLPSYESIICMYADLGKGTTGLQFLQEMPTQFKQLLNTKVFDKLMAHFVKVCDKNSSLEVFRELRDAGNMAEPQTYRLLIETYLLRDAKNGPNLEQADQVLRLMRHDGAPITTQCFAALLRARGVLFKDFEGARNFYRGMVKNSRVLPDDNVFRALIESYVLNGKQSELRFVHNEMKRYHVPQDVAKNIPA